MALILAKGPFPLAPGPIVKLLACLSPGLFILGEVSPIVVPGLFFGEGTLLCYPKCPYSGEEKPHFHDLGGNGRWTLLESTRLGWMVFGGNGVGEISLVCSPGAPPSIFFRFLLPPSEPGLSSC